MTEPNPQDKSDKTPGQGDGDGQAAEKQWWESKGFTSEEAALSSFDNAQRKISEQGNQIKQYETEIAGQAQPAPASNAPSEDFFDDPMKHLKQAAREVAAENRQQDNIQSAIRQAAKDNNVEEWQVDDIYKKMSKDPEFAVKLYAQAAAMNNGNPADQAQEARDAIARANDEKSRAGGTPPGAKTQESAEPDWNSMSPAEMRAEFAKRGMIAPAEGGYTTSY